jgi:glycosyltransferase involved in cell wall biosynthesis
VSDPQPSRLALIVPCYNEAARLNEPAFQGFLSSHPAVSVLFVDDGSTDATFEVLERLRRSAPDRIGVMRLETNRGKAEAVRLGILDGIRRRAEFVGFWDADLSTPIGAVDDFLTVAAKRPEMDILLGSRVMLMGRDIRRSARRHYLGRVFATAASVALNLPVYDTQCGAKLFRVNDATSQAFASPFRSRWIFDVEVIARYLAVPDQSVGPARRARIYELTVPAWHDVPGSKLRFFDFVRSMFELASIWRDLTTRSSPR